MGETIVNIKLYASTEKDFAHNGLGFLRDVINCYVEEEHNGMFELTMTYKVHGHLYEHLEEGNIIKADASDRLKGQLFRIYKTIKKQDSTIEVFARHISYDLLDDAVKEINIKNQSCEYALNEIFRQSDFSQHFKGYSDIQHSANFSVKLTSCLNAIVGTRGSIIDTFGNGAEILRDNFNIHVLQRRGEDDNVLISYKKNMTGIEIEEDRSDLITRIYPYAKKTNENNEEVTITPSFKYIDSKNINKYEHPYIEFMDFSEKFEENEEITDEKFRNLCEKYYKQNKCDYPKTNFKIQFIPLAMTENYKDKYKVLEKVGMMDRVIIRDTRFGIDTDAKVIKTKYDVIREKYENIELGDPRTSLGDIISGSDGADGKPGLDGADGIPGPVGPQGPAGPVGPQGIPGVAGQDGKTYYTWIRYAENEHGYNMTNVPNQNTEYIGIAYNKESPIESDNPSDYTWSKFKGDQGIPGNQGEQGIPGIDGVDGQTYYTWIKYADDEKGTNMSDSPEGKTYIGISYNNISSVESNNPKDYAWTKFVGDKGEQGEKGDIGPQGIPGLPGTDGKDGADGADGKIFYTWIRYANDEFGNGMSNLPTNKEYIGIAYNQESEIESNNPDDYVWSKFVGDQGIPGAKGEDGQTYYTWIKYADTATGEGMSDNSENKEYIGIAYNMPSQQELNDPSLYTWTKLRGDQGLPGVAGADGITYYTWVKYADDEFGANMSDSPEGKAYLGLAYNRLEQQESNNPSDYTWSLIKGEQGEQGLPGIPGINGEDGQTYYTWIRYANDEFGNGMSNIPTGKDYIGIAYNMPTETESDDASLYAWSLIRGEQGIAGIDGIDGKTYYTWIKYSKYPDGKDMQDSSEDMKYIGIAYNKDTIEESNNPKDYAWSLIKGQDGTTFYTWIKYANDQYGNGMSDSSANKEYIGIAYNMPTQQESTNPSDYTWTKIKGDQGLPGAPGSDGVSLYTWVKYADDNKGTGMSDDPEGKAWLGLAFNKEVQQESNDYREYTWSKIKGEDGKPGADGDIGDFPDTLPAVPSITVNSLFATIALSWTYESKVYYEYELYASQIKDFTPNVSNLLFKGQASAFLHEVKPSQTWYYRVRAVNSHGRATAFSAQASGSTFKLTEDNIGNYIEELAIGNALIKELNVDKVNAGRLSGVYIDARELTVTDGNNKRTLYIDSFGNVHLDVTSLSVNSSAVATQTGLNTAINNLKTEVSEEIAGLDSAIDDIKDNVLTSMEDGLLTDIEKSRIKASLDNLETEKSGVDSKYNELKSNTSLAGTALSNLNNAYNSYTTAYNSLVSVINTILNKAKVTQTDINKYTDELSYFKTASATLQRYMQKAIDAIATAKDDALKGDMTTYTDAQIKVEHDRITSNVSSIALMNGQISQMNSSITQLSNQITSKVDVNGVKSIIEQNPDSVKIGFNGITDKIVMSSLGMDFKTNEGLLHTRIRNGTLNFLKKNGTSSLGSFQRNVWSGTSIETLSCSMDEQTTFSVAFRNEAESAYNANFVVSNMDFGGVTAGTNIYTNLNMHNAPITNCASISCGAITCSANIRATNSIVSESFISANGDVTAGGMIVATSQIKSAHSFHTDGFIQAYGDIVSKANIKASGDITAKGEITATNDIVGKSSIVADKGIISNSVITANGAISTNSTITAGSTITTSGMIKATSQIQSNHSYVTDGFVQAGGNIRSTGGNVYGKQFITVASVALANETARTFNNVEIETEATMSMTPNMEHIGSSEVVDGECVVYLPTPLTRIGTKYVIQITPIGLGNIYVAEKHSDRFVVKGDNLEFDYVIKVRKAKVPARLKPKVIAEEVLEIPAEEPVVEPIAESDIEPITIEPPLVPEVIVEDEVEIIPDVLIFREEDMY